MELIMDHAILFEDDDNELNEYVNYVRRPYTIRCRIDHFNKWDDYDFKVRFRLSKETVIEVLNIIKHSISSNSDRCVIIYIYIIPDCKYMLSHEIRYLFNNDL